MEKRGEPRLEACDPVRITALGERERALAGAVVNTSETGLGLLLDEPALPGLGVMIEWGEKLMLAEVCYCEPRDGRYAVGLRLWHTLLHTSELAQLSRRLLGEAETLEPAGIRRRRVP